MDLIKESKGIHKCLVKRWDDLEFSNADIIRDAGERGMVLTKSQLSNYRNAGTSLTQKQVMWLCFRFFIPVKVQIGNIVIGEGNVINYEIPPYNELEAIKTLNKHKALFK